MGKTKQTLNLSPQTIGDDRIVDDFTRILFISHWERIIGSWYSISSEAKPKPFRSVGQKELEKKTSAFWRHVIQEILAGNSACSKIERTYFNLLLSCKSVCVSLELGRHLLYMHKKIRIDLQK